MPDDDAPVEGGLEPASDAEDSSSAVAVDDAPEAAEETPEWRQKFPGGEEEMWRAYREAQNLIATTRAGAPAEPEPDPEPEEEDPEQSWFDAPWSPIDSWDRAAAYAQSDDPAARRMAAEACLGNATIPQEYQDWVLSQWAEIDRAGALDYVKQRAHQDAIAESKRYADERYAELEQRLLPVQQRAAEADHKALLSNIDVLAQRAQAVIPDFADHAAGVTQLLQQRALQDDTYIKRLFACSPEDQLQEIYDLTAVAAWRARPALEAEAAAEAEAATTAKTRAGSERGSGSAGAAGGSGQSEMKRKFTSDIKSAMENPA